VENRYRHREMIRVHARSRGNRSWSRIESISDGGATAADPFVRR
jgi:hypothetical protein